MAKKKDIIYEEGDLIKLTSTVKKLTDIGIDKRAARTMAGNWVTVTSASGFDIWFEWKGESWVVHTEHVVEHKPALPPIATPIIPEESLVMTNNG